MTSVIDPVMLATMRSIITSDLLPDTCNIVSITNTPDGEGGVTQARGTIGTAIACRLDVIQAREQVTGGAIQPYTSYMMSLPYNTTVNPSNIIEHNSIDYSVKPSNVNQSWIAVMRVELEKL
jgi:hypothetical protein